MNLFEKLPCAFHAILCLVRVQTIVACADGPQMRRQDNVWKHAHLQKCLELMVSAPALWWVPLPTKMDSV
jgi:hypothetical protein